MIDVLKCELGRLPITMRQRLGLVLAKLPSFTIDTRSSSGLALGVGVDTNPGLVLTLLRLLTNSRSLDLGGLA
jgi:hypothetical protein